jgi:hypothetical protein
MTRKIGGNCCRYEKYFNQNDKYCNPGNIYEGIYNANPPFHLTFNTSNNGYKCNITVENHAVKHIDDFNIKCVDKDEIRALIIKYFFKQKYAVITSFDIFTLTKAKSIEPLKGNKLVSLFKYNDATACFVFNKKANEITIIAIKMINVIHETDTIIQFGYTYNTNTIDYTDNPDKDSVVETVTNTGDHDVDYAEYHRVVNDYYAQNTPVLTLGQKEESDDTFISKLKNRYININFTVKRKPAPHVNTITLKKLKAMNLSADELKKLNTLIERESAAAQAAAQAAAEAEAEVAEAEAEVAEAEAEVPAAEVAVAAAFPPTNREMFAIKLKEFLDQNNITKKNYGFNPSTFNPDNLGKIKSSDVTHLTKLLLTENQKQIFSFVNTLYNDGAAAGGTRRRNKRTRRHRTSKNR